MTRTFACVLVAALSAACGRLALDDPHGPSGSGGGAPLPVLPGAHGSVGLVAACGGAARVRADWSVPATGLEDLEGALFLGADRATLFQGAPHVLDLVRGHAIVDPAPLAAELYVGLGLRATGTTAWTQAGPLLRVHAGPVVFVNPALPPTAGDGTTPATAFGDLALGALIAFSQGGGSVWIAEGDVVNAAIPLFEGVHLCGGFGPDFALGRRDPRGGITRLVGVPGQAVTTVEPGPGPVAVLDGVALTGPATTPAGVDLTARRVELRALTITACQRGIKLRSLSTSAPQEIVLAGVRCSGAQLEGLSVDGAFDLWLEACAFDLNGNEGADLNHLWAPSGATSRLVVRGTSFRSNGNEGLDCHLGAPAGPSAPGGAFEVLVQDCDFEGNGLDGLRVDVDYEAFPAWDADVVVRGSRARANGGAGVHLDLDARTRTLVHGVVASANALDGVLVTSETFAGMTTIASSVLLGNRGAGARGQQGNVAMALSHCVFAGNVQGSVASPVVRSSAHSCARYQEAASTGVLETACVATADPAVAAFERAPLGFGTAMDVAADVVTLAAASSAIVGDELELLDDGTPRDIESTTGTALHVAPAPAPVSTPARCWWFDGASGTAEDWRPRAGSFLLGAGLAAPGAAPVDAGVFGAPLALAPGLDAALAPELFAALESEPAWSRPIAGSQLLRVTFLGGDLDPTSVPGGTLAWRGASPLTIVPAVVSGVLEIPAPSGGWRDGDRVELHATLSATDGRALCAPLAIPIAVP